MSQNVVNPYRYVVAPSIEQCTGFDSSDGGYGTGALRASPIQASSSFTVTGLSCHCLYTEGTTTLGLYSDDGGGIGDDPITGVPSALLGYTTTTSAIVGLHSYSMVSSVAISSGTDYWIAVYLSATAGLRRSTGNAMGSLKSIAHFSTTLPDPYGTITGNSRDGLQVCLNGS